MRVVERLHEDTLIRIVELTVYTCWMMGLISIRNLLSGLTKIIHF